MLHVNFIQKIYLRDEKCKVVFFNLEQQFSQSFETATTCPEYYYSFLNYDFVLFVRVKLTLS